LALVATALSTVCRQLDQPQQVADYAVKALDILDALGDEATKRTPLLNLAELAHDVGRPSDAVKLLAHAVSLPQVFDRQQEEETQLRRFRATLPEPDFARVWDEGIRLGSAEIRSIAEHIAADSRRTPASTAVRLTPREEEVLHLLVAGRTYRAIGEELFISRRTAEKHAVRIMEKLGLTTRAGLIAWAVRNGMDRG
ncbi:MAG: LuxR C-terminal-related transcriptional regulator, partial [Thermomicrobiales bacterium]